MKEGIPMTFNNKVAIITGAADGIGKAIAIQMAKLGAKLVLADHPIKNLVELIDVLPLIAIIN